MDADFSRASRSTFIAAGYLGSIAIVALSLVPATSRPHTGAGGGVEHWLAYALVSGAFALGYRKSSPLVHAAIALTLMAALLELLQKFIPGRNAEVSGFLSSAAGVWASVVFALGFAYLYRRLFGER